METINEIVKKQDEIDKYDECDLCPKCGSTPNLHIVEDYDMMWHDGNVTCTACGSFVRRYDAG